MTTAQCFNCGEMKTGPFSACTACGVSPVSESELLTSLSLSELLCKNLSIVAPINRLLIGTGGLVPDEGTLARARVALQDPVLMEKLGLGSRTAPAQSPALSETSRGLGKSNRPKVFLRAELQPPHVYVGQQATYTVWLYTQTDIGTFQPTRVPTFQGFSVRSIPQPAELKPEWLEEGGDRFGRIALLRRALFPLKEGRFTVEPMEVDLVARVLEIGPPSAPAVRSETLHLKTEPQILAVEALPASPPGFSGVVGELTVLVRLDRSTVAVGETATLTIRATGRGLMQTREAPGLAFPTGIRASQPIVENMEHLAEGILESSAEWTYFLVAQRPGRYKLPALKVPHFDPLTKQYQKALTRPIALTATEEGAEESAKGTSRFGMRKRANVEATALHRNPFHLLGATARDGRRRIVELAEERSLDLDHEACQKVRGDLTNPRTRLSIEIAWLPGVSPKRANQLLEQLLLDPVSLRDELGLPPLAHANLLAAAIETIEAQDSAAELAEFVEDLAKLVAAVAIADVSRDINEDRLASGFPEVQSFDVVEGELTAHKRYFRDAVRSALNQLPSALLVEAMTLLVGSATQDGECHAPWLIDELVDSYEVDCQEFLNKEGENIRTLIAWVRRAAPAGPGTADAEITRLEAVLRNWDRVAQPIQLGAKSRGVAHQASNELAHAVRNLAVSLFNEYDMLAQSKRMTALLQDVFAEVPDLAERSEDDAAKLEEISAGRNQQEEQRHLWAKRISFRAEIGAIFKDVLSIDPEGVRWKKRQYPLEAITRVRWGSIRRTVNGIPAGTTHIVAFGDNQSEAYVELGLSSGKLVPQFVERLWRAVGPRLLVNLLEALRAGEEIRFGPAAVRDGHISLVKRNPFYKADESVWCGWNKARISAKDGSFVISSRDDATMFVALPYIHVPNVHVLEHAVRSAFKIPNCKNLSELLDIE